jgi:hypothetical protein
MLSTTQKENVDPQLAVKAEEGVGEGRNAATAEWKASFEIYDSLTRECIGTLEGGLASNQEEIGSIKRLSIHAFQSGKGSVFVARYVMQERFCKSIQVKIPAAETNSPFSKKVQALYEDLKGGIKVALAHLSSSSAKDKWAVLTPSRTKNNFSVTICPKKTWEIWSNVIEKRKLYLGMDLDRTMIDTYTIEGLQKLVKDDPSLNEKEKCYALSHALALENYRHHGQLPLCMQWVYGEQNIVSEESTIVVGEQNTVSEQSTIVVNRGKESKLIFTKYANGNPLLFWIRPGWTTLWNSVDLHYFPCFVTHSSAPHAFLALKVLGIDIPTVAQGSGVKPLTICREGRKFLTKAFHMTGSQAEKCFIGIDDLCDGSDELLSNYDGVSIWNRSDLRKILKPIPYHAYSGEPGKSDELPLHICSTLLLGIHQRFFASLDKASQECNTFDSLLSCTLPDLDDIVAYYGRNNTTYTQAVASFINEMASKYE